MRVSDRSFSPAEAAARLGVSAKALRLYEQYRLLLPGRTRAGYRVYDPAAMARAAEIVALRKLGLSLAQVARALDGDVAELDAGLAGHEARLRGQAAQIAAALSDLRRLRADLCAGNIFTAVGLAGGTLTGPSVAFDLPWPWGGEAFALHDIPPLSFITGPLGSGKTRFAVALAEALPARFLGLDRNASVPLPDEAAHALDWLVGEGAEVSVALTALLAAIHAPGALVVDMIEQDLSPATQTALVAHLRLLGRADPLFLLTRSSAILDLEAAGSGEAILYCPANHSPPMRVAPLAGSPGYEAVATCLAKPEVRARTVGVIAMRA